MRQKIYYTRPGLLAVGVAAILVAGPVRAADVVGEEPPVPAAVPLEEAPVNTWSGPYVGVSGAYVLGTTGYSLPAPGSFSTDGWYGNVFAGYDFQFGQVVAGVEGDIGYGTTSGGDGTASSRTRTDGTLRARLGYAMGDRALIYGTGGLAAASLTGEEGGTSQTRTVLGWTAGAGVQVKMTQSVFGKLEYRYTDFGNESFATASGANTFDNRENKVLLGVGFKF